MCVCVYIDAHIYIQIYISDMYIHTHKQTYLYLCLHHAAYQYIYHLYLSTSISMQHAPSCVSAADDSYQHISHISIYISIYIIFTSLPASACSMLHHTSQQQMLLSGHSSPIFFFVLIFSIFFLHFSMQPATATQQLWTCFWRRKQKSTRRTSTAGPRCRRVDEALSYWCMRP